MEREYPRWVHRHGNGDKHSVLVQSWEEEEAVLDRWKAEDAEKLLEVRDAVNALLAQPETKNEPVAAIPRRKPGRPRKNPDLTVN